MAENQQQQTRQEQQQQAQHKFKVIEEGVEEPQTLAESEPHTVEPGDA